VSKITVTHDLGFLCSLGGTFAIIGKGCLCHHENSGIRGSNRHKSESTDWEATGEHLCQ